MQGGRSERNFGGLINSELSHVCYRLTVSEATCFCVLCIPLSAQPLLRGKGRDCPHWQQPPLAHCTGWSVSQMVDCKSVIFSKVS